MAMYKLDNSEEVFAGRKIWTEDKTPFQKRIASISMKIGEGIVKARPRHTFNLRTPRNGLRKRPPKYPSPFYSPSLMDSSPSTNRTTSQTTFVTLRTSCVTPSETPHIKSVCDSTSTRKLRTESPVAVDDIAVKSKEWLKRTSTEDKTNDIIPSRSKSYPLKSHSFRSKKSRIRMFKVSESAPLQRTSSTLKLRHLSYTARTRTSIEDGEFNINPEPVPYQPQNFMSSTLLKKVSIPKRHLDSFSGYEYTMGSKRGVILHTDRYQWDSEKNFEGLNQRDRLRAELEYMDRLREIKRRREMLPHRAQLDLLMGGKKVEFSERFDIQREIQKLKSLVMPKNAKDLFHGRGFQLPEEHSSLRPRRVPLLDYDSDEDAPNLDRLSRDESAADIGVSKSRYAYPQHQLPRISNKSSSLGLGSTSPILLAREKRTVDQIKARISVPSGLVGV